MNDKNEDSKAQFDSAFSKLTLENGAPKVVFPYGYQIVEIQGEWVIQPNTPDEYVDIIKEMTGEDRTAEQVLSERNCLTLVASCASQGCAGNCIRRFNGHYVVCHCVD